VSVGDQLLLRHVEGDRTWCLLPVTLLREGEPLAVRISAGCTWLAAEDSDGERVRIGASRWQLGRQRWLGHDVTYVLRPGRWYATGLMTDPADGGRPVKWYVNFQLPYRRQPWGWDTADCELDLEGPYHPRVARLRWKDAGRFLRLAGTGRLSHRTLRGIASDALAARREIGSVEGRSVLHDAAAVRCPVPDLDELVARGPVPPDVPPLGDHPEQNRQDGDKRIDYD